ncbi:ABC transporter substrate-binding protein [Streptomyces sp. CRN 30]|uniref:ABC transporter substrate-binding protein n=1 Tax=Streptomyces sp. CRN 30 TaxID=3075613 RepID=UPI002A7F6379|nr:extracellular solute-binding protein [Streptomyces sp. CRN 30]
MTAHPQDGTQPPSRRKFVAASAAVGAAALAGTAGAAAAPAHARPTVTARTAAGRAGAVCTPIPNKYDEPFEVCDDELFVFMANYKPFENPGFFDAVIGDALRAAFPGLKIKAAAWDRPIRYEDLDKAGVVPDIVIEDPRRRIDRDLEPRGWTRDLTDDVRSAGIDLGALNPAAVAQVRARSDGGLYGVPLFVDDFVLLHNKKIFDMKGLRPPRNGVTYDEAFRLAKKLTFEKNLVAYKGYLQHPDLYLEFNQLGLYPFVPGASESPAPEDVRVDITSAGWQRLGANMERFLLHPHNIFTSVDDYLLTGSVAMAVDSLWKLNAYALSPLYLQQDDAAQWRELAKKVEIGVTSVPVLGQGESGTYQPNTMAAFLPPQSTKKAQALQVLKWLVSQEGQVELARHGMKPALRSRAVEAAFGSAVPELAGIDTSGIFWGDNAVVSGYENTEYWDLPLYMVFRQHVLKDGLKVSSALTITETVDIPKYIKSQVELGFDW